MPKRAETLFQQLTTRKAIQSLIGTCEDAHFDCKEWPAKDEDGQKMLAKAACGLANAEGGVLVIGVRAKKVAEDQPDVVVSLAPVPNTRAVKSRILEFIGQLVEPGIEGIRTTEISEAPKVKSGFVVVYIPASEALPRRSRKDWKFYLRIGSGTFPMEYFQIADMFGRRPQPHLEVVLEPTGHFGPNLYDRRQYRYFILRLSNTGRGIAKFPCVRLRSDSGLSVYDGGAGSALPLNRFDAGWLAFRGGIDHVIYPGSSLTIAQLIQLQKPDEPPGVFSYAALSVVAELYCEGAITRSVELTAPEHRV